MFEKLKQEEQRALEFYTRKLGEIKIDSLLTEVAAGCQKLKNGEQMPAEAFLAFFRGFATIQDIARSASHTDYLQKRGVSRKQLAQCLEITGNFKSMEFCHANAKEYFDQFVVSKPDLNNKPRR